MKIVYSNVTSDLIIETLNNIPEPLKLPKNERIRKALSNVIFQVFMVIALLLGCWTSWISFLYAGHHWSDIPQIVINILNAFDNAFRGITFISFLALDLMVFATLLPNIANKILLSKKSAPTYWHNKRLHNICSTLLGAISDGLKIQNAIKNHISGKEELANATYHTFSGIRISVPLSDADLITANFKLPTELSSIVRQDGVIDFSYLDKLMLDITQELAALQQAS